MNDRYELSVCPNGDDTFSAEIACTAFVDHRDGFDTVEAALEWARERTALVPDPFTYEED